MQTSQPPTLDDGDDTFRPYDPAKNHKTAEQLLDEADQQIMLDEARRDEMMHKIAKTRMFLAAKIHRMESGEMLDFENYPFQKEIFANEAKDLVIMGSVGWGKTVYSVLDDFAKAMWGMRVIHVLEKTQKRNIFVGSVIDPIIHANAFYLNLLDIAKDEKSAEMDSATAKSFGDGSMIFLGANSESDFASYRGDATLVDEFQLCNANNVGKLFGRRTGTFYRFQTIMGVPTGVGSIENRNMHFQFMETDQRRWHIPCPHCQREQVLNWEGHFIDIERNQFGGVTSLKVKDEERSGQNELEIRPICMFCDLPMVRLHKGGRWIAMNPGSTRRGYQLSSLYNPLTSINSLYKVYIQALNNPMKMAEFINEQLGEPYSESGTNFTLEMLRAAATGRAAGVSTYRFYHQSELGFRPMELN